MEAMCTHIDWRYVINELLLHKMEEGQKTLTHTHKTSQFLAKANLVKTIYLYICLEGSVHASVPRQLTSFPIFQCASCLSFLPVCIWYRFLDNRVVSYSITFDSLPSSGPASPVPLFNLLSRSSRTLVRIILVGRRGPRPILLALAHPVP